MAEVYNETTFAEQHLHCDNCGWSGLGHEAHIIDFYGVSKMKQVECPDCNTILASIKSNNGTSGNSADPLSMGIG